MASHLIRGNDLLRGGLIVALIAFPAAGLAEGLVDPTRPATSAAASALEPAVGSGGPVLQSILISPQRRVAVISGETVRTGETVGGALVVKIAETEVVLRVGNEIRVLRIYPDFEKRAPMAGADARVNKKK